MAWLIEFCPKRPILFRYSAVIWMTVSFYMFFCKVRWNGCVIQIPLNCISTWIFKWELAECQSLTGGQKKQYKDNIIDVFKQCEISTNNLKDTTGVMVIVVGKSYGNLSSNLRQDVYNFAYIYIYIYFATYIYI